MFAVVDNGVSRDSTSFDAAGRPMSHVTTRGGATYQQDYTWDKRGRRTGVTWAGQNAGISYAFNETGQLDTLTAMDGQVTTLSYNADLQLESINLPLTHPATQDIGFQYPSTHRTAKIKYGQQALDNDFGMFMSQDNMRRTSEVGWVGGVGIDTTRTYTYDAMGRIDQVREYAVAIDTTSANCALDVDNGTLCLDENTTLLTTVDYDFDAVGNPTGTGISVSTGNRLDSIAGYTLTWDDAGFLQSKVGNGLTQLFYWNARGQLDSVSTNGTKSRYKYDGLGRRVETDIAGTVKQYWHDGDDLFVEFDGAGNPTAEYTTYPGTDRLHSVKRGGTTYYYATDEKGTVLGLYDGSAQTENLYRYDVWGQPQGTTTEGVENTLRYIGREWDDTAGLLYLRARYYDPEIRRFISEDPIGLAGGINLFAYTAGDPVNQLDAEGLQASGACFIWQRSVANPDRAYAYCEAYHNNLEGFYFVHRDSGDGLLGPARIPHFAWAPRRELRQALADPNAANCRSSLASLSIAATFDASIVLTGGLGLSASGVRASAIGAARVVRSVPDATRVAIESVGSLGGQTGLGVVAVAAESRVTTGLGMVGSAMAPSSIVERSAGVAARDMTLAGASSKSGWLLAAEMTPVIGSFAAGGQAAWYCAKALGF